MPDWLGLRGIGCVDCIPLRLSTRNSRPGGFRTLSRSMENSNKPLGLPAATGKHSNGSDSSVRVFWCFVAVIAILGVASVVGRQRALALEDGDQLGWYHTDIVWLGGFTVFPGYILGLLSLHDEKNWFFYFPYPCSCSLIISAQSALRTKTELRIPQLFLRSRILSRLG